MKTKRLVAALICWAIISVVQAQTRGAIWVHGLGSNQNEWAQWSALFTAERELNTLSNGYYTSDQGVGNMATQVRGSYPANSRNIYFGHSMGGVVGRHIDTDTDPANQNSFGAIITAGSALNGARIANAAQNGEFVNAVSDGISTMAAGPMNDLTLNIGTFGQFQAAGMFVELAVNQLKEPAQRYINNSFINQSISDFMEGSNYQNSAPRNTQTNTAKLLVYGNEESPVHWRIASEQVYADERLVGWANTTADVYETAMWINYGFAAVAGAFTFGLGAIPFVYSAIQWGRGMNWVRYDSERIWNYLIGAGIPSYFQVCYEGINADRIYACLAEGGSGGDPNGPQTVDNYIYCSGVGLELICHTYYASTNGQSDGLIKAPSQVGYNSGWANGAQTAEALGVNHLQMRKHDAMRSVYNNAFDGTYGQVFITPKR